MKEFAVKIYQVHTTYRELDIDCGVHIIDAEHGRYMLNPDDLKDLPNGTYNIRGEVTVGDKTWSINETITLSDV